MGGCGAVNLEEIDDAKTSTGILVETCGEQDAGSSTSWLCRGTEGSQKRGWRLFDAGRPNQLLLQYLLYS
jgi:hypothetical protein